MDYTDPNEHLQAISSKPKKKRQKRAKDKTSAERLDPCDGASDFLKSRVYDGDLRLRRWRGSFWEWSNGGYWELNDDDIRSDFTNWLNQNWSNVGTGVINNCLDQLRAQCHLAFGIKAPYWVGPTSWTGNTEWRSEDVIACRNCLIHLPSYAAGLDYTRPATPHFFCTSPLAVNFDADAPDPERWNKFLQELFDDDVDSIHLLQDWFGYCLGTDTSQQKVMLMVGPTRSGKGTIARVQQAMTGPKCWAGPTLASLGGEFGLAPLLEKKLAFISDARIGKRSDISTIVERLLALSGEDGMDVNRKHKEQLPGIRLPARFCILTNELPKLADPSGALANRMLILQFRKSWLHREDTKLTSKLVSELPGILKWAMDGWVRLRCRGNFVEPASSSDTRKQLDDLTSPVGAFVRQRCDVSPNITVTKAELYGAYKRWCSDGSRNFETPDNIEFGRQLRAAVSGLVDVQKKIPGENGKRVNHWCYRGINLRVSRVVTSDTELHVCAHEYEPQCSVTSDI